MAPIDMIGKLSGFSSMEVGVMSLVAFFILAVVLLALCAQCTRKSGTAYDVNGATSDGTGGANGSAVATTITSDTEVSSSTSWRDHSTMPPATLERKKAYTN